MLVFVISAPNITDNGSGDGGEYLVYFLDFCANSSSYIRGEGNMFLISKYKVESRNFISLPENKDKFMSVEANLAARRELTVRNQMRQD